MLARLEAVEGMLANLSLRVAHVEGTVAEVVAQVADLEAGQTDL